MSLINNLDENEELVLINSFITGNHQAFEKLFRIYYPLLCNYLKLLVRERVVIEEIVQELFVNIWENRKTFSPKGRLKSYLFKSVRNSVINYFKHESVKQKSSDELKLIYFSNNVEIDKQYESIEFANLLNKQIALLPDKCREIFILVKFNELSYKETAEVLNLSVKTIENQMGIALKKLKESLLIYYN